MYVTSTNIVGRTRKRQICRLVQEEEVILENNPSFPVRVNNDSQTTTRRESVGSTTNLAGKIDLHFVPHGAAAPIFPGITDTVQKVGELTERYRNEDYHLSASFRDKFKVLSNDELMDMAEPPLSAEAQRTLYDLIALLQSQIAKK